MLPRENAHDPDAVQPGAGSAPVTVASAPDNALANVPAGPVTPPSFDTGAAEEEIGRLVLRVRDVTNSMLNDARRQAEDLLSQARADSARLVEAAQRQAARLQSDNVIPEAVEKLQAALVALGEVNAALVRHLSNAAAAQGQPGAPTAQAAAGPTQLHRVGQQ